jgi:hypothetical protein
LPLAAAFLRFPAPPPPARSLQQQPHKILTKSTVQPSQGKEEPSFRHRSSARRGDRTCPHPSWRRWPCPSWWLGLGFCEGTGRGLSNRQLWRRRRRRVVGLVVGLPIGWGNAERVCAVRGRVCVREREKAGTRDRVGAAFGTRGCFWWIVTGTGTLWKRDLYWAGSLRKQKARKCECCAGPDGRAIILLPAFPNIVVVVFHSSSSISLNKPVTM